MRKLFCALAVAFALAGCTNEQHEQPQNIVAPDPQQLTQTVYADDNAGKSTVNFTTAGAWTSAIKESATAESTRAATDWLSISPSSGDKAGDYTINISLETNYTGEKRSAIISIICGGEKITITVAQEAVTASGDKPKPDPEPSGEGILTNETTGRSVKIVGVTHAINGADYILVTFHEEEGSGYTPVVNFTNPLQDGKLRGGTYTNSYNYENNKCTWLKPSSVFNNPEEGTVKVERKGDVYTFTINMKSDKGNVIKGSFTGAPKFEGEEVKVSGVSLSETQKTVEFGGSFTLSATVLPENATDKRIQWSSGNTAIATVDQDGVVKAVAAGKATITATSVDGGKTAACEVTISPAVAVQSIKVMPSEVSLFKGEFYENLAVAVLPENAHNKDYTWKSSNAAVADYNGKVIEAKSAGVAVITFTTEDQGKTATVKVTVTERQGQGSGNVKVVDPSGKYDEENFPLIEGIHTITAKNKVELSLKDDRGNGIVRLRFVNPLSNGRLAAGNYTIVRPESASNNTVYNFNMYSDFGYYESGIVAVSVSGDTYTIAMTDTPTSNGRKITCSYTGRLTYTNEYLDVTAVTLDKNTLSLHLGASAQLTATVNPANAFNKNVVWSTSNSNVASVSDGYVYAAGVGTATITVTTEDGAKTADCLVTVTAKPATGSGTFSNNRSQSIVVDKAEQWVNGKEPKEIELRFLKPDAAYANLSFILVRTSNDTGALKAGTYNAIRTLMADELGIKYSDSNTGSATVTLSGENYTVTLDVTSSDNTKITGTYTGKIIAAY